MDLFAKCAAYTTARECRERGIYPYFHALESRQDTEVIMEGRRRIMLGSNNYLGLTAAPKVVAAAEAALAEYGTGCSGSRFLNGTLRLHLELERELADFVRKDGAVTFSTGFQSNLGIISALVGRGDYVVCDRENHASIYDGCRLSFGKMLRYRHADMDDLESKLRVMVDDAHGLGVIGEGGRGTASRFGLEDKVDVIMGTFSKSLASLGGYMAASELVCDYVRHNSRPFIFSASIPPSACAAALAALRLLREHPELPHRLLSLASYARAGLKARGLRIIESETPIIPIYTYEMENTLVSAKRLYDAGVYVNPVLPPAAAPGECLLRVSCMATHTEALLDEAMDIIAEVLGKDEHV